LLGLREHGWLVQQGADAVEGASAGRVQPAEATDAMEARGEDVLEEPAEELERLQIDVPPLAGGQRYGQRSRPLGRRCKRRLPVAVWKT
jgi:hypothetical protein